MLSIKFIKENSELVKKSIKDRFLTNEKDIDDLIKHHDSWINTKKHLDNLRHKRNKASEEINNLKKQGKDIKNLIQEIKQIPKQIQELEKKETELKTLIKKLQKNIPNLLHKTVPIGKDETENKATKKWGKPKKNTFKLKPHGEILENLNQVDFKKATKVSGAGFVYLKDKIALLDLSLQRFAIDFMQKKKFTLIYPPYMLRRKQVEATTDLASFKETIYKIENEDLYLIPSSELVLISLFANETIKEENLPIKLVGVSANFRKEIGSHGVDTRGLHRMHQFNKIEQIIICKPEDSYKYFEESEKFAEEIMQKLKLPYRVMNICSGDLGNKQEKQLDIEAYFPREKKYEEVTSCSNCTNYQSHDLNIKYINKKNQRYCVHIVNNTALATSRIMRAILENCQQKDGTIKIPTALHKYTGFKEIEANKPKPRSKKKK